MWMPRASESCRSTATSTDAGTRINPPCPSETCTGTAIRSMPTQSSGRASAVAPMATSGIALEGFGKEATEWLAKTGWPL